MTTDALKVSDLKQGKCYQCIVDGDHGAENLSFIQLAIDPHSSKRFVLGASQTKQLLPHSELTKELIGMTYQEIKECDYEGDPRRFASPIRLALWIFSPEGELALRSETFDMWLNNFVEVNE